MRLTAGVSPAKLASLLAGLLLGQAGLLVVGSPVGPDAPFTRFQVLGVFLVALSFILATLGWGAWISSKMKAPERGRWMLALACGTMASSLAAMALGAVGLISYDFAFLASAWVLLGCWLGGDELRTLPRAPRSLWAPVALFAAGMALWFASASLMNGSTDPFLYHLTAPRVWTDFGRLAFRAWYPATVNASYWEYLFIWGNLLFGAEGGRGLIPGQLFGQFMHVGLGVTLVCASVYALASALIGRALWAWLAVLLCLCSSALDTFAFLAKNDYAVAGWGVAGVALLFAPGTAFPGRRRFELWLASALIGFAVMAKLVLALPLGVLFLAWLIAERKSLRLADLSGMVLAGFLAMLPGLLRNLVLLGDPVFPFLVTKLGIESPWQGPTAAGAVHREFGGFSRDLLSSLSKFWQVGNDVRYFSPLALALPVLAIPFKGFRKGIPLSLAGIVTFAAYSGWQFTLVAPRWLAPVLFVQVILAAWVLAAWVEWLGSKFPARARRFRATAFLLPVLAIYPHFGFDLQPWERNVWRAAIAGNSPTVAIRQDEILAGGWLLSWLRTTLKPGERVATTGFELFYYVSHLEISAIPWNPELDRATYGAKNPLRVVRALREFGVKYVLDIHHWDARFYAMSFGLMIAQLGERYPNSLVYMTPRDYIVDIEKLEAEMTGLCGGTGPVREWDWYS